MSHRQVPRSATVSTPRDLAAAMVTAARGSSTASWLDPCIGDGALVAEMAKQSISADRILAVDIAPDSGPLDHAATTVRGVDFLEWAAARPGSVDHVVMNPPYVALSRVRGKPRERALSVSFSDGGRMPLKANYWAPFLLAATECVRPRGSLVAVLPAAWDFARYASRVRQAIGRSFGEVVVVRCASPLFPEVREGVVVIAAFDRGGTTGTSHRLEVPDLSATIAALRAIGRGEMPSGASSVRSFAVAPPSIRRLDELVEIRIGAVTGDAGYFLLSEAERRAWGLPRSALRQTLSRSRHLTAASFGGAEWSELLERGERVWLFRPTGSDLKHPAVRAYLDHGKEGGCNLGAHKIAKRELWHRTPLPGRVDGFMSGMSRRLPFLVLSRVEGLTASNTLYVIRFRGRVRASEKASLGVLLLTSPVRAELAKHARVYADGLWKLEPTDLGAVRVPVVQARADAAQVLRRATSLLLKGQDAEASAVADAWVAAVSGVPENRATVTVEAGSAAGLAS